MEINTVALIGLGGLGIAFGECLLEGLAPGGLRVVADQTRIGRYAQEGVHSNGKALDFTYVRPEEQTGPADLALFMVKGPALAGAIREMRNQIGPGTILVSALNGITSERYIAEAYGWDNVLYCIAQGMDVRCQGSEASFKNRGMLCVGDKRPGPPSPQLQAVARMFDKVNLPYRQVADMKTKMWGKFMLNVGINQVAAVTGGTYGEVTAPGPSLDTMLAAMAEVRDLAPCEGVRLTDEDIAYWLKIARSLDPESCPSMAQDVQAKRPTEVELFAGTVVALGEKHGVDTPVNRGLYERLREIEAGY